MFNLVLNHHCLHIRKAGGQQCLTVNFNRTLINTLRPTINAQMPAKLLTKPHLLKKSFPKLVSKESVRSQERRFRARPALTSAEHDLYLLHWPCPIGSQGHQSGLFCLSGGFGAPGDLPETAVLQRDAPCPVSVPRWGWMGPPGDASISPLPTVGSFTHIFLPAKLWLRLPSRLC